MLGTLVPVKEVARIAHARGIPVLVDGAQGAVHLDVDVRDIDCDFYAFTGHKLYGPTGIGVLYGKYEHLAAMPPFNGGGEMIREVFEDRVTYGEPPHKFEAGTPSIVQAIGLGAAIDYVASIGKARIRNHEAGLLRYAQDRLREINSLRIIGTAKDKGPIVSFEMKGAHPHDVATIIDRSGVAVRAGTHCVMPLLARFGVTATCRASFAMYNTREEIDCLAQALLKAQDFFSMTDDIKADAASAVADAELHAVRRPRLIRQACRRKRVGDPARGNGASDRRDRRRAQDGLRPGNSRRHLRARPDLQGRHRRRPHGQYRHDADDAELPVGGGIAGAGGECGRRACRACARPRSLSSGIRRGIRAGCRTRPAPCSICGEGSACCAAVAGALHAMMQR